LPLLKFQPSYKDYVVSHVEHGHNLIEVPALYVQLHTNLNNSAIPF